MSLLLSQLLATPASEATAAIVGLAYLLLAVRRNLLCWLCAFVSTAIYLWLFAVSKIYMQALLQVFYLVMAVYGFIDWKRGSTKSGDVLIRSWNTLQHLAAACSVLLATAISGWLLARSTDAAAPYLDSFVTWGSVITTYMVARRVIENWLYWIIVDGLGAWLFYTQGLFATALLFGVYLGIVIHGYFVWRRDRRRQLATAIGSTPQVHVSG